MKYSKIYRIWQQKLPKPPRRGVVLLIFFFRTSDQFAIFIWNTVQYVRNNFPSERLKNNIFFQTKSCKDIIFSKWYYFITGDAEFWVKAVGKASWDIANQGEILGMTWKQEKTVGFLMAVSLNRSSCYLLYGHNEGRIGTRTTTIIKRRREIMFSEIEMEWTGTRRGSTEQ